MSSPHRKHLGLVVSPRQSACACGIAVLGLLPCVASAQERVPSVEGTAVLPRDLSPWSMFMNADVVVKAVMVGLVIASIVTWTVWLAKTIELLKARRQAQAALATLNAIQTLRNVKPSSLRGPAASFYDAALAEFRLTDGVTDKDGLKERVALPAGTVGGGFQPPDQSRHRRSRHHRSDRTFRRPVRHGVGHHEQLYRHIEIAHNEPCGRRAGDCRSTAGDRAGIGGRYPRRRHLQFLRASDHELSRGAFRQRGRSPPACQSRSRSRAGDPRRGVTGVRI